MSSLTVVCPNFRRHVVKVTPGTLLRKVVEEACLKSGYDVDSCVARNQNKILDLSLPFRLSGLANNSTLELSVVDRPKSECVEIALQIPDGRRQIASLPLATNLKDMVDQFSGLLKEDLLSTEGGMPSCVYMNRKYVGPDLEQHTLASLGITGGKCLIRYQRTQVSPEELAELEKKAAAERDRLSTLSNNFDKAKRENEERALIEAQRLAQFEADLRVREEEEARRRQETEASQNMEVEQPAIPDRLQNAPPAQPNSWSFDAPFAAPADPAPSMPPQPDNSRLAHLNSLLERMDRSLATGAADNMVRVIAETGRATIEQIASASEVMETNEPQPEEPVFSPPCERHAVIFARSQVTEELSGTSEISDEFFEVNIDDVKKMQKDLKQQARMYTQRSLLPRSFLEKKNRELKMAAYRHSVIRFVLGEQVIQANFDSGEPVCRLFEFVSSLFNGKIDFTLTAVLNQPIISSDSKNFVDTDLAPKTTLTIKLKSPNSVPTLNEVPRCTLQEADKISFDWLACNTRYTQYTGALVEEPSWQGKRTADMRDSVHTTETQKPTGTSGPKWFKHK